MIVITHEQIKSIFLDHGFSIKPGHDDLADYVYQAAYALLALQNQRIEELQEQLEAIGAGGVEPLRKSGALQQIRADARHCAALKMQKAMVSAMLKASEAVPQGQRKLTARERKAWAAYKAIAGDTRPLWLQYASMQDIGQAGIDALLAAMQEHEPA